MLEPQTQSIDLGAVLARRDALEAELCRRSLRLFVEKVWPIIEPDRAFSSNWHIDALCSELETIAAGSDSRTIVNVPPGTMKTLLISVMFPAWLWASKPGLRFLTASYGSHRTIDAASKLRRIVESDWYQEHYAVTLADDQNAKTRFNTDQGGWCIASSVGGVGTGEHPDYILIDDPLTEAQSRSDTERAEANAWYDRTISSRGIVRGVNVIIIMQRLHEDDLSGHLLTRGGYRHICFPMRYEPSRPRTEQDAGHAADPRDPRREVGELLWPSIFTPETVRRLELDLGPYGTAGQLQQRPAPEGGGLFKREWFQFVGAAPVKARRVRGWDTGATEGGGDATVGCRMAEADDLFYVEDVVLDHLSPAGVEALMLQTAQADGIAVSQREEREGGSAGKTVTSARVKQLKGFDYREVIVSHDKVTRSKPFRAQVEAKNVYLVRGDWNEAFIRELCDFPVGKEDNQVDAASCAFNAVLLEPKPSSAGTWGRTPRPAGITPPGRSSIAWGRR